jgi:hypothetical protein
MYNENSVANTAYQRSTVAKFSKVQTSAKHTESLAAQGTSSTARKYTTPQRNEGIVASKHVNGRAA